MKLFKIILGIIGAAVVLTIGLGLKSKFDRDHMRAQVTADLAKIAALGIPTNDDEFKASRTPSKTDAWWQLKDVLTEKPPPNYTSMAGFDPLALIFASGVQDLPTLRIYLSQSLKARTAVLETMRQGKSLNLPETIYGTPLYSDTQVRNLTRDFVIDAVYQALSGNRTGIRERLAAARYLANCLLHNTISYYGETQWRTTVIPGAMRILEITPVMSVEVYSFLEQPNLIAEFNPRSYYQWVFLNDCSRILSMDSRQLDRFETPKWAKSIIHAPSIEEVRDASKDKPSGYMPESATALRAYIQLLDRWKPILGKVAKGFPITDQDEAPTKQPYTGMSKEISELLSWSDELDMSWMMDDSRRLKVVAAAVIKALRIKRLTGGFPQRQEDVIDAKDAKNSAYHLMVNGFSVNALIYSKDKRAMIPVTKINFPTFHRFTPARFKAFGQQLAMARTGKANVLDPKSFKLPPTTTTGPGRGSLAPSRAVK